MRKRKRQCLIVVSLLGFFFLVPPVVKSEPRDSRMASLADPAFTHRIHGVNFVEEGGVPFLPNTREILIFPHSLVSDELFPSHTIYLDFYNTDNEGTGAVVLRFNRFALGLLHSRDDFGNSSWVIGSEMNDIDGSFSANFYDQAVADVGIVTPEPPMPYPYVDIFGGINVGSVLMGLSAGFAIAHDDGESGIAGGPKEELGGGAAILTVRAGAGVVLDAPIPLQIDAGFTLAMGHADARQGGDSLEANNNPVTGSLRVVGGVLPKLDLVLVGGFSRFTQEFEVVDDGVPIDRTGAHVTDFVIQSIGGGLGALWTPVQRALIVGNVSAAFGKAEYTVEINGPEDERRWVKIDAVLGTEFELVVGRFWIRGGIGQTFYNTRAEFTSNIGLPEPSYDWLYTGRRAAAGIGFKVADSVLIDFTLNLDNLASDAALSTLALYTSLTWSM